MTGRRRDLARGAAPAVRQEHGVTLKVRTLNVRQFWRDGLIQQGDGSSIDGEDALIAKDAEQADGGFNRVPAISATSSRLSVSPTRT